MRKVLFILCFSLVGAIWADYWDGAEYIHHSVVQQSHAEQLLSRLELQANDCILDLGCGDGRITALLTERVPEGHVIGIDPSDSMLTQARRAFPHVHFLKGKAEDFSLEERFDHIIAIHVMHWIKDQKTALDNIYAHLKPGGRIHFILAPSKEGLPFYDALQKTLSSYSEYFIDFENPQQIFDMETYRKLMIDAGFFINAIHYVYHESLHKDRDTLQSWIQQWLPHGKHLQESKRASFFNELMDHYPNPTHWGEYVLIIEAMKPNHTEDFYSLKKTAELLTEQ